MSYDPQRIPPLVSRSTRTQRCWDHSKPIPPTHTQAILAAATGAPSKQNLAYYRVHSVTDRTLTQQIYQATQGFGLRNSQGGMDLIHNSQTLAPWLLVFEPWMATGNEHRNLDRVKGNTQAIQRDQTISIGIALAYANLTAHLLRLSTGFCGCFDPHRVQSLLNCDDFPLVILGIGHADQTRLRTKHHLDNTITYPSHTKETIPVIEHCKHEV